MQQPLGLALLFILIGITLVAFFQVLGLLFTRSVEASRDAIERMPGRSFLLGLVNSLFLSVLVMVFAALAGSTRVQILVFPGLLAGLGLAIGLAFGWTAVVQTLGERLLPERKAHVQNFWGGAILILACLTPYIGWFGLTLYVSLLGIGGFLIGLLQRMRRARPAVIVVDEEKV